MSSLISQLLLAVFCLTSRTSFNWGVNGHPNVQEGYRDIPISVQLDLVKELGAKWYRTDWSEAQMRKDPKPFDMLVSEASKRQINILPVIMPDVSCYTDHSPEEIKKSSYEFGKWVANRYKGKITHWELANELDSFAMIRPGETDRNGVVWQYGDADMDRPEHFNEQRYSKVKAELIGLGEGIKSVSPSSQTIIDSSGWLHYGFFKRLIEEDKVQFDIIGWHWYSEMGDMTKVKGEINVLDILRKYGKPIWITEINKRGGSMDGEDEQSKYLAETANQLRNYPDVHAFFVYELLDEPYFGKDNPESYYGLVKITKDDKNHWVVSDKKAAFTTYQKIIESDSRQ